MYAASELQSVWRYCRKSQGFDFEQQSCHNLTRRIKLLVINWPRTTGGFVYFKVLYEVERNEGERSFALKSSSQEKR
jgi:hypothetical protein